MKTQLKCMIVPFGIILSYTPFFLYKNDVPYLVNDAVTGDSDNAPPPGGRLVPHDLLGVSRVFRQQDLVVVAGLVQNGEEGAGGHRHAVPLATTTRSCK